MLFSLHKDRELLREKKNTIYYVFIIIFVFISVEQFALTSTCLDHELIKI